MVIPSPWTVASKDQGQYDYWLILANILPMSRTFSVDEALSDGSWIQLMFVESVTRRAQIDRIAQLMAESGLIVWAILEEGTQQASLAGAISRVTELACAGRDHSGCAPATYKGTPHAQ